MVVPDPGHAADMSMMRDRLLELEKQRRATYALLSALDSIGKHWCESPIGRVAVSAAHEQVRQAARALTYAVVCEEAEFAQQWRSVFNEEPPRITALPPPAPPAPPAPPPAPQPERRKY